MSLAAQMRLVTVQINPIEIEHFDDLIDNEQCGVSCVCRMVGLGVDLE